jgi:hypothetical protein
MKLSKKYRRDSGKGLQNTVWHIRMVDKSNLHHPQTIPGKLLDMYIFQTWKIIRQPTSDCTFWGLHNQEYILFCSQDSWTYCPPSTRCFEIAARGCTTESSYRFFFWYIQRKFSRPSIHWIHARYMRWNVSSSVEWSWGSLIAFHSAWEIPSFAGKHGSRRMDVYKSYTV